MNRFTDRTVVVTGGGGGIGTAVCTSFAEEGAKVAVLDDESAAASTAQAITDAGGTAIAIGCDITERSSVDAGVGRVVTNSAPLTPLSTTQAGICSYRSLTPNPKTGHASSTSIIGALHMPCGHPPDDRQRWWSHHQRFIGCRSSWIIG